MAFAWNAENKWKLEGVIPHGVLNAQGKLESILEAMAARDDLEGLGPHAAIERYPDLLGLDQPREGNPDDYSADRLKEMLIEKLETHADEFALSVQVRGGWVAPGLDLTADPEEFQILLSWGGPAARVVGDLDFLGCVTSARLEWCDWGREWAALPASLSGAGFVWEAEQLRQWVELYFYFGS
tara:strand:+ start:13718 stop:14266 length:549 start_codon:yes stop_codon:yes gene_type:complete